MPKSTRKHTLKLSSSPAKTDTTWKIVSGLVSLLIYIAILVYIFKLEADHCKCIRDWRHTYIKIIAIIGILFVFGNASLNVSNIGPTFLFIMLILSIVYLIASVVYVWAFYTYVGDLNETQCSCAVNEMKNLNQGMLILRWVYVVLLLLSITMFLVGMLMGFGAMVDNK